MITLRQQLDAADVAYDVLPESDTDGGVSIVAKMILLSTSEGIVRVLVPRTKQLDLWKARDFLGVEQLVVTTEELQAGDRSVATELIVDARVGDRRSVVIESSSGGEALRVKTADLLAHTHVLLADLCEESGPAADFRH